MKNLDENEGLSICKILLRPLYIILRVFREKLYNVTCAKGRETLCKRVFLLKCELSTWSATNEIQTI